jgi:heme/copper-type cytochrome/quinol oxidase subunit 2
MQPNEPKSKAGLWTAIGIVVVIVIIALIYFATQKTIKNDANIQNDPITNAPITGTTTVAGAERIAVTPSISALEINNLQTFPYKVQARVKANLPDACSDLDTPTVARSGNTFTITATASKVKDAVCAQVITPKEIVVDLPVAGLSAGKYAVKLGTITKTFTLASDNTIEYTSDK